MYTIGLDFGSDSARAILVDTSDGKVIAESVHNYPRWAEGKYCDNATARFRHHPLDYLESLDAILHGILDPRPEMAAQVRGIGVDTTAATPCLVDRNLVPLALNPEHKDNPDAMFVLWKDHSGAEEASEIEAVGGPHLENTSGTYSPEYYWGKLLHVLRSSPELKDDAYQFLELCDWIPTLLCGNHDPEKCRISEEVVVTKMLYNPRVGGLPSREWFASLDSCWLDVYDHTNPGGNTCDKAYGTISAEVAARYGLPSDVAVVCGQVDSFAGAVGAGITETRPVMTLGTSSGYITVSSLDKWGDRKVRGAFSQGEGFVLPGMFSVEMGLSAFGDAYAWLSNLLSYIPQRRGEKVSQGSVIAMLAEDAAALPLDENAPLATDYFNGRRSPDQNPRLTGSITGLRLRTSAPELYRAVVESTCFATRAIIERMEEYTGIPEDIMCIGGISQKAPYVMQMLADVCGVPMKVYDNSQTPALGSAICAAAVAGIDPTIQEAQKAMMAGIKTEFIPDRSRKSYYDKRYALYRSVTGFQESVLK